MANFHMMNIIILLGMIHSKGNDSYLNFLDPISMIKNCNTSQIKLYKVGKFSMDRFLILIPSSVYNLGVERGL